MWEDRPGTLGRAGIKFPTMGEQSRSIQYKHLCALISLPLSFSLLPSRSAPAWLVGGG